MKAQVWLYDDDTDESIIADIYFEESLLSTWFINIEGDINVTIDGYAFTLVPNPELLNYLDNRFVVKGDDEYRKYIDSIIKADKWYYRLRMWLKSKL